MEMKVKDSRDDLSQCGCDTCDEDKTSNSVKACSVLHVALVLVAVRVTVVSHEEVVVVIYFCVAILFVICCIKRCTLYISSTCTLMPNTLTSSVNKHGSRSSTNASRPSSLVSTQIVAMAAKQTSSL